MKINVTNKDKKHEFTIKNWKDVTLETWVKLIESEKKTKIKMVQDQINLMTEMPKELINQLTLEDVLNVCKIISKRQASAKSKFNQIVKVGNEKFGFIPNLEQITLGEYADLEHYIKKGIDKNIANIAAILYRPITDTEGKFYSIKAYDGKTTRLRAEKFQKMKAKDIQNALVFFWNLGNELLKVLELYLMDSLKKAKEQLMNNSQKSGVGLA